MSEAAQIGRPRDTLPAPLEARGDKLAATYAEPSAVYRASKTGNDIPPG